MIEKDVKVIIYAESKDHGFDMHKEMSFDDYCKQKGYIVCKWHKVADGDLPVGIGEVRVVYKWCNILYYGTAFYLSEKGVWVDEYNPNRSTEVVAWTELPEYTCE